MSQELYYTSAPKGLKPGSHGYCTVAATSGMAPNVADKLESLSAYRHIFAAGSGHQSANPIVYSYLRLNAGGRTYFVLSRIADAGLDYTQRNNKFAHHVALDAGELPPAGPAWLLAQESFLARVWQGEPRLLATGRKPPQGNLSTGICRAWEAVTGDAGWAGVLAESATRATPTFLIIEPTTTILPLLIEAQSLLSPKQRWGVTLSTYFTKLPTGVDCQWRCVLKGSPEAKGARTIPGSLIIDLTRKLGPATGGVLVEAARSGVMPATPDLDENGNAAGIAERPNRRESKQAERILSKSYSDRMSYEVSAAGIDLSTYAGGQSSLRQSTRLWMALAAVTSLLIVSLVAIVVLLMSEPVATEVAAPVASVDTPKAETTQPATKVEPLVAPEQQPAKQDAPAATSGPAEAAKTNATDNSTDEATASAAQDPTAIASETRPEKFEEAALPRADVPAVVLPIEEVPHRVGQSTSESFPATLRFPVKEYWMWIYSGVSDSRPYHLFLDPPDRPGQPWKLTRSNTKDRTRGVNKGTTIATISIDKDTLHFEWTVNGPHNQDLYAALRDSILLVGSKQPPSVQLVVFRNVVVQHVPLQIRPDLFSPTLRLDGKGLDTDQVQYVQIDNWPLSGAAQVSADAETAYRINDDCTFNIWYARQEVSTELRYEGEAQSGLSLETLAKSSSKKLLTLAEDLRLLPQKIADAQALNDSNKAAELSTRMNTTIERQQELQKTIDDLSSISASMNQVQMRSPLKFSVYINVNSYRVPIAVGTLEFQLTKQKN